MQRIVRAISAYLDDGTEIRQGQTVEVSEVEAERLDAAKSLVPEGYASFDEFHTAAQDAYRGSRGDILAGARQAAAREGEIVDLSPEGERSQVVKFIDYLTTETPSIDEVVAKVDGNPNLAAAMLEAEKAVTGGSPRKGLEKSLESIIQGG